jgi:hypothetical protein
MNSILAVRSEIKKRFGRRGLAAAHVQGLWQAMDEESEGFNYSGQTFPKINEVKRGGEGVFIGLQSKQLFEDHDFNTKLKVTESRAWETEKCLQKLFRP